MSAITHTPAHGGRTCSCGWVGRAATYGDHIAARVAPAFGGTWAAGADAGRDVFAAIDRAEAEARAQHQAGTCHLSEWSCSHCEAEATS